MTPVSAPAAEEGAIAAALQRICDELRLPVSPGQLAALQQYLQLLQRWNGVYNLTAVRDPAAMLHQHLADCLAVVPAVNRCVGVKRVLDVGSGGGLPGAVLAVMNPALDVSCVDPVGKKMAFVRQVAGALSLPALHAVHARVEQLRAAPFDLVTSRAFATLADFTRLTATHLAPQGVWMAMKGRVPDDEIGALPPGVEVFHVEPLVVPSLDAQRCLIWMRPSGATTCTTT